MRVSGPPPTVIVCLPHGDAIAIVDALRPHARVRRVSSAADVERAVGEEANLAGMFVAAIDLEGKSMLPLIRAISARNSSVPIVALCDAGIEHSGVIRQLAMAGAHEFLFRGIDSGKTAVRAVLQTAMREASSEVVCARVLPLFPPVLHGFVEQCLHQQDAEASVQHVARELGINRRTLLSYCDRHGLPGPAELLGWCRLFLVGQRLSISGQNVEAIAMDLGWPSSTALRNMVKRYTKLGALEVRQRGGLEAIVVAFEQRLARLQQRTA